MTQPVRILWVDDSPDLLRVFTKLLTKTPGFEVVGTLLQADNLVAEAGRLTPDVVMLDLTMPGKCPLEATTELSAAHPEIRTIIFSGYDDEETVRTVIKAGAWGLVPKLKGGEPGDVVAAVRQVLGGERYFPSVYRSPRDSTVEVVAKQDLTGTRKAVGSPGTTPVR